MTARWVLAVPLALHVVSGPFHRLVQRGVWAWCRASLGSKYRWNHLPNKLYREGFGEKR